MQEKDFNKASKSIAQESRSSITGDSSNLSIDIPISPYYILKFFEKDPFIRSGVNAKTMNVMSDGWSIEPILNKPNAERQKDLFMEWSKSAGGRLEESGEEVSFDEVLFDMIQSLNIGDEIYLEVQNTIKNVPGEIHVLDWEDMRIREDLHGIIKGYYQYVDGKIVAEFEPEEVIHKNLYSTGTRKYGFSLVWTVLNASAGRLLGLNYSNAIFLNQKPKGIWFFDMDERGFKESTDAVRESKKNAWYDFFVRGSPEKVKYQEIPLPKDMTYKDFVTELRKEILIGIGVPPGAVFLPGESSGWDADVELALFDQLINFIRTFIENIINNQLITRFGFDAIKFKFNRSNKRNEEKEANIVTSLLNSGIITINEARTMIGKQDIENGDVFAPKMGFGFGFNNQSDGSRENDQTGMKGEMVGDRETSKIYNYVNQDTSFKNKKYFRASNGSNLFNKAITKSLKKPGERLIPLMKGLEEDYKKSINELIEEYIDKIISSVGEINNKFFMFKRWELRKISDPSSETGVIDTLKITFINKAKVIGNVQAIKNWEATITTTQNEIGMPLSKIVVPEETLKFLENMNIDLVGGLLSEMSDKLKTQIRIGLVEGEGIPQISKRIEGLKDTWKNRAEVIARTEVSRAVNMGSKEVYKNSGLIKKVQVLIGSDPDGTCGPVYGGSAGSLSKEWEIDKLPPIPNHPRCTCVILPVIGE